MTPTYWHRVGHAEATGLVCRFDAHSRTQYGRRRPALIVGKAVKRPKLEPRSHSNENASRARRRALIVVLGSTAQQVHQQLARIATRFNMLAYGSEQLGLRMHSVCGVELGLYRLGVTQGDHPLCNQALSAPRASPSQQLALGRAVASPRRAREDASTALGAGVRGPIPCPSLAKKCLCSKNAEECTYVTAPPAHS